MVSFDLFVCVVLIIIHKMYIKYFDKLQLKLKLVIVKSKTNLTENIKWTETDIDFHHDTDIWNIVYVKRTLKPNPAINEWMREHKWIFCANACVFST